MESSAKIVYIRHLEGNYYVVIQGKNYTIVHVDEESGEISKRREEYEGYAYNDTVGLGQN